MGLGDEWARMRDSVAAVATDVTRVTTVTRHRDQSRERGRIGTEVQLDGDSTTTLEGDVAALVECHHAAMTAATELADARLRMLATVVRIFLP